MCVARLRGEVVCVLITEAGQRFAFTSDKGKVGMAAECKFCVVVRHVFLAGPFEIGEFWEMDEWPGTGSLARLGLESEMAVSCSFESPVRMRGRG